MAEYIERDEAIRRAVDACIKIQVARTGVGITQFEAIDMADAIYEIQTADVVEVRHGEWKNDGEDWFCNRCNRNALCDKMTGEEVLSNICPNCGADMRGEKNGKE